MIQFNLLPDVKLKYIKARRMKQTVMMSSLLVGAAAVSLFVLLFMIVNVTQKSHLKHLDEDITKSKNELKEKPDLAKILTIQNQLGSLPTLHQKKPVASRVFGYVQQLTPQNVSIETFTINYKDKTMKIEGSADALASVNTFTDTLKFTNFVTTTTGDASAAESRPVLAFSDVVLSTFAVANSSSQAKAKPASYTITLKFKQDIFSSDKDVKLQVANKITTRSETEKPSSVFESNPNTPAAGGAN